MRSHLDTSTKTKCPVATSPSMQWQSMPKKQTCAPHLQLENNKVSQQYCIINNANAPHGIFQNLAFLYTQPMLGLPRFAPGIPFRRCETEGSLDLRVQTCWNMPNDFDEFPRKFVRNFSGPRRAKTLRIKTWSILNWMVTDISWLRDQTPETIGIIPEQFAVEIQIFITHLRICYI